MKLNFSLFSVIVFLTIVCLAVSHITTSIQLYQLKNQNPDFIFEIVENGPNNGGGGSDIAILVAARTAVEAFDEAKGHGFTAPWTVYRIGQCLGESRGGVHHLRGPYIVGAAVNSRNWKAYYSEFGDPPTFRTDIYPEE